ncbi:MAG: hypothetical protein MJ165_04425 [Alphaproteobacteria bacterium]|nr:hypothetical protein [Alphaproteobacteria bacterium]
MKKIMNKINCAIVGLMVSVPAFADGITVKKVSTSSDSSLCDLLARLHGVFDILRILAFVGAAFYMAGWAWSYIANAGGKEDKGAFSVEDIKKKGVGLLVGFTLLFIIGLVLSFIMSAAGMEWAGCAVLKEW